MQGQGSRKGLGGWRWPDACEAPRPHHSHPIDGEAEAREQLDWSP